jgi:hypothetical protein
VRAAAISTLFATSTIKPSLQLRRRPCGISGWDTPVTQLLPKFYTVFLSNVIKLMITHVRPVVWASIIVYLFLIQKHSRSFLSKLFIRMFGLHQYLVTLATNIMLFF